VQVLRKTTKFRVKSADFATERQAVFFRKASSEPCRLSGNSDSIAVLSFHTSAGVKNDQYFVAFSE